jgi:hypothetical protein
MLFSIGILLANIFHLLTAENWRNSKFYNYRNGIYLLNFLLLSADQLYFIIIRHTDFNTSYTYLGFIVKGLFLADLK